MGCIRIQAEDFSVDQEWSALRERLDANAGAVAAFVGLVREVHGDSGSSLELEHYPGMSERSVEAIVTEAEQRWRLAAVTVVHRVGRLRPTDQIVLGARRVGPPLGSFGGLRIHHRPPKDRRHLLEAGNRRRRYPLGASNRSGRGASQRLGRQLAKSEPATAEFRASESPTGRISGGVTLCWLARGPASVTVDSPKGGAVWLPFHARKRKARNWFLLPLALWGLAALFAPASAWANRAGGASGRNGTGLTSAKFSFGLPRATSTN